MVNVKSSHTANAPNHQCCSSGSHSVPHCLAENIIALSETDSAWMPLKSNEGNCYIKGPSYYWKCIPKITLVVNYFIRAPNFNVTRLCLFFWHFLKIQVYCELPRLCFKITCAWLLSLAATYQSLKGARTLIVGSCWAVLQWMVIRLNFENTDIVTLSV